MNNKEFVENLLAIKNNHKTSYLYGTFGQPVTASIIAAKAAQYPGYYPAATQTAMKALVGKNCFGFDCVGMIKGLLWGWSGSSGKSAGGAVYASNNVPDLSANGMIICCSDLSADFSKIQLGEAVWLNGHIGVYIGDGKVLECTPSWDDGIQVTACRNIGAISGLNARTWTKHGKLPYITYTAGGSGAEATTGAEANVSDVTVGSAVKFSGGPVYGSSAAAKAASSRAASACAVTALALGAAHPYHLVSTDGAGVYGWVNAGNIGLAAGIAVGSLVTITGDTYTNGTKVASWAKQQPHTVARISGDKALVGAPNGINSWVYVKDLRLV